MSDKLAETADQKITRPGKTLFPDPGLTKADLAGHYERVAEVMLPRLAHRPLVLHRFPDGVDDGYDPTSLLRRIARKPDPWADIADHAGSAARDALGA